jgi:glycosyltransferase involved in cell wall biosynthesis
MSKLTYGTVFLYASLQFCGNIEEYFRKHTDKLVVFIVMPRTKNTNNLLRVYKKGKLVKTEKITLSTNAVLYYVKWYLAQLRILLRLFRRDERITLVGFHPICFFGMTLQSMIRNIQFVYWIGDYFPATSLSIKLFEVVKRHYHNNLHTTYYLSDGINRIFNKKIINSENRRTVMWGVVPPNRRRSKRPSNFELLFVGLIKESQGLEFLFTFLHNNPKYYLNIIGVCDDALYQKYNQMISKLNISTQVFFPNIFYTDDQLGKLARRCSIGIGLYNIDRSNPTFYTDPGKIKAYAQMGLPVIMTNVSGIAPYIKKFGAGIVIARNSKDLAGAVKEMHKNYERYIKGLRKFNDFFCYEKYYANAFHAIEIKE